MQDAEKNAAPLLWVQNLTVGIQRGKTVLTAVDDISFTVRPGEIVGIVGESGCGKSLTALSITGLLPAAARKVGGTVLFDGENLDALSEKAYSRIRGNAISTIFQEPMTSLNPLMRIGRQIAEPLVLHGHKNDRKVREQVLDIMGKVGLPQPEKLLQAYPHQLSGGMRQRVMIASAIICRPKLLIADEPTTALDVTIQAQILELLKDINRSLGTAILFISHDLGVISQICDRVLVMYAGRLVEEGSTRNIFWHPVHEYTKGLMESIPTKEQKGRALVNIPGRVPSIEDTHFGCPFAPRCSVVREECLTEVPPSLRLSESHSVCCFATKPESEMEYVRI